MIFKLKKIIRCQVQAGDIIYSPRNTTGDLEDANMYRVTRLESSPYGDYLRVIGDDITEGKKVRTNLMLFRMDNYEQYIKNNNIIHYRDGKPIQDQIKED